MEALARYYKDELGHRIVDSPPTGPDSPCFVNPTVLCGELMPGHMDNVAYWYLSPSQLASETIAMCSLFIVSLLILSSYLPRPSPTSPLPLTIRLITLLSFYLQVYYKLLGFANNIFFMMMPCNMMWTLATVVSWAPISPEARNTLVQLWFSFQGLVWVVFATSDTNGLEAPFEVEWFWINHILLVVLPFVVLFTTETTALTSKTTAAVYVLTAGATFGLFYFGVATPLSFKTGLNLNYMMSPPPGTPGGENYRVECQPVILALFFVARGVMVAAELVFRGKGGEVEKRSYSKSELQALEPVAKTPKKAAKKGTETPKNNTSAKKATRNLMDSPVAKYFYGSDDEKTAYPGKIVEVKLKNGAQGPSVVGYKVKYDDGDVEWVNEKEVVKMMRLWEKVCSKKEKRRSKSRGRGQ